MIQVKIIKKPTNTIEGEINDWFKTLPHSYPNMEISVIDVKMTDINNIMTVLILYHIVQRQQKNPLTDN